jgi:hypothetical protein
MIYVRDQNLVKYRSSFTNLTVSYPLVSLVSLSVTHTHTHIPQQQQQFNTPSILALELKLFH